MADKFACTHCGFVFEDPDMEVCPRCGTELGQEWNSAELRSVVITELTEKQAKFVATLTVSTAEEILASLKNDGCFALEKLTPHQVEAYAEFLKQEGIHFIVESEEQKSIRLQKQLDAKTAQQNAEVAKAQARTAEAKAKAEAAAQARMEQEAKRNAEAAKKQSAAQAQAEAETEKARLAAITAQAEAEANAKAQLELEKIRMEQEVAEKEKQAVIAEKTAQVRRKMICIWGSVAVVLLIGFFIFSSISTARKQTSAKNSALSDLQVLLRDDPFMTYKTYTEKKHGKLTLTEFDGVYQTFAGVRKKITTQKKNVARLEAERIAKAKEEARTKALADLQVLLRDDPFMTYETYTEKKHGKLTLAEFDKVYQIFADVRKKITTQKEDAARLEAEKKRFLTDVYHNPQAWKLNSRVIYELADGVNLELMPCPAGNFGGGSGQKKHHVTLTKPFLIGKYEVTQAQYKAVMGENPSYYKGVDLPVEQVNWHEAMAFCDRLNKITKGKRPQGYKFTLPTEAQCEYATIAGSCFTFRYTYRDLLYNPGPWDQRYITKLVGTSRPNSWGIYGMYENVWEWCLDWYSGDYYGGDTTDPTGPANGSYRVARGAQSIYLESRGYTYALRIYSNPDRYDPNIGFRIVLSAVNNSNLTTKTL